jgi:hypothetical protein
VTISHAGTAEDAIRTGITIAENGGTIDSTCARAAPGLMMAKNPTT